MNVLQYEQRPNSSDFYSVKEKVEILPVEKRKQLTDQTGLWLNQYRNSANRKYVWHEEDFSLLYRNQ